MALLKSQSPISINGSTARADSVVSSLDNVEQKTTENSAELEQAIAGLKMELDKFRINFSTADFKQAETRTTYQKLLKRLEKLAIKLKALDIDFAKADFNQIDVIEAYEKLLGELEKFPLKFLERKKSEAKELSRTAASVSVAQLCTTPACRNLLTSVKLALIPSLTMLPIDMQEKFSAEFTQMMAGLSKDIRKLPFHALQNFAEYAIVAMIKSLAHVYTQSQDEKEKAMISDQKDALLESICDSKGENCFIYQILDVPNEFGKVMTRGGFRASQDTPTVFKDLRARLEQEWPQKIWRQQITPTKTPELKADFLQQVKSTLSSRERSISSPVGAPKLEDGLFPKSKSTLGLGMPVSPAAHAEHKGSFDNSGFAAAKQLLSTLIKAYGWSQAQATALIKEGEELLKEKFQDKAEGASEGSDIRVAAMEVRNVLSKKALAANGTAASKKAPELKGAQAVDQKDVAAKAPNPLQEPFARLSDQQIRKDGFGALVELLSVTAWEAVAAFYAIEEKTSVANADDSKGQPAKVMKPLPPQMIAISESLPALLKLLMLDEHGNDAPVIIAIRKQSNWKLRLTNLQNNIRHIEKLRQQYDRQRHASVGGQNEFDLDGFTAVVGVLEKANIKSDFQPEDHQAYQQNLAALKKEFTGKPDKVKFDVDGFKDTFVQVELVGDLKLEPPKFRNACIRHLITGFAGGVKPSDLKDIARTIRQQVSAELQAARPVSNSVTSPRAALEIETRRATIVGSFRIPAPSRAEARVPLLQEQQAASDAPRARAIHDGDEVGGSSCWPCCR